MVVGGDAEAAGAEALQKMLSKTSSGAGNGAEELNPLAVSFTVSSHVLGRVFSWR